MIDFASQPTSLLFTLFSVAAVVVLVFGAMLTRVADRFAEVSGIGEAITGSLFLGAMTSMAGSVTSVTAAAGGHAQLALSNAIGGIAAQTLFLAMADIAWRKGNLGHASASLPNMVAGVTLIILLTTLLIAEALPPFLLAGVHPATPILLLIYVSGLHMAARSRDDPGWVPRKTADTRGDVPDALGEDSDSALPLAAGLLGLGFVVGVAGWLIAETGLQIAAKADLREGLVGALLTAIATSTPELVTTIAAVRRGSFTLAVGGILGGNTFDVLFVASSDIAYRGDSIYHAMAPDQAFLILMTILMIAILLVGLLRRERHGFANIGLESVLLILVYFAGIGMLVWAF